MRVALKASATARIELQNLALAVPIHKLRFRIGAIGLCACRCAAYLPTAAVLNEAAAY